MRQHLNTQGPMRTAIDPVNWNRGSSTPCAALSLGLVLVLAASSVTVSAYYPRRATVAPDPGIQYLPTGSKLTVTVSPSGQPPSNQVLIEARHVSPAPKSHLRRATESGCNRVIVKTIDTTFVSCDTVRITDAVTGANNSSNTGAQHFACHISQRQSASSVGLCNKPRREMLL